MAEQKLMKDGIDGVAIQRISHAMSQLVPSFDTALFEKKASNGLENLELKQRVTHLIDALHASFNASFQELQPQLMPLIDVWDRGEESDALSGFAAWPITDYVAVHGIDTPELALPLLEQLTELFSAEFAIRPFIINNQDETLAVMKTWAVSSNHHVRRLASEGCRPKLPWGQQLPSLIQDPTPIFPILEQLVDDESEYVRRSVANNLNDISKDHPHLVSELCQKWMSNATSNTTKNRTWLVKHALRTLIKSGYPSAFEVLGYSSTPDMILEHRIVGNQAIELGEALDFTVSMTSTSDGDQKLIIDYVIHHMKANGKLSEKVFKLKTVTLKAAETLEISKSHLFKSITTRRYYSGEHLISILVNGKGSQTLSFNLSV